MPNLPEGFKRDEQAEKQPTLKAKKEIIDLASANEIAQARLGKAQKVSKHAQEEVESTKLSLDGLDAKVQESMQKHINARMLPNDVRIDLAANIPTQKFSNIPYPTNDDIGFTDTAVEKNASVPNPYADYRVTDTTSTSSESRESSPEASLRNLYDMMRTKPFLLGITKVARFAEAIKLSEHDKQIVLSPSVMLKLASLANKHGDTFLQIIGRENTGSLPEVDGSGFITESKVARATAEWKKFVDSVESKGSRKR